MPRPSGSDTQRTRYRILDLLKRRGEADAASLAETLAITATAVRQHLQQLAQEELVSERQVVRGPGRPTRLWTVTQAANDKFPDGHAVLTVDVLQAVKRSLGESAVDAVIAERTKAQIASYQAQIDSSQSAGRCLRKLAQLRSAEGYMADVQRQADGSWLLYEQHCPICVAAESCQGLCRGELELFQKSLGPAFTVERTEHLLSGDSRCTYRIATAES